MTTAAPLATADGTIPELTFRVTGAEPDPVAAVPTLRFALELARSGGGPVRAVSLTVMLRIDVLRREHPADTHAALAELFGLPEEWHRSMRPLAWTQTTVHVPSFTDRTTVPFPVACGTDPELAVTKYLRAAKEGTVPLGFLFNGTLFYEHAGTGGAPALRAAAIPWSAEAGYDLPAGIWHGLVERYHGGSPWLRLPRETYDRLDAFRARNVLGSADDAVRALLDRSGAP
ncbi:DUF6084 family protein [Streptomyces sp. NPDC054802]